MREHIIELMEMYANKQTDMTELVNLCADAFCALKKHSPDEFKELINSLEGITYIITEEEAVKIVRHMEPKGQNWSPSQVKDFVKSQGIDSNFVNWYLVMNMVYNDYYNTAKLYGLQNDANFYFSLAKDFIFDPDAHPYKVEKYFMT